MPAGENGIGSPSRRPRAYDDVDIELASRALASVAATRLGSGLDAVLDEPTTAELPAAPTRRPPVLPIFGGVLALAGLVGALLWLGTAPAPTGPPRTVVVTTTPAVPPAALPAGVAPDQVPAAAPGPGAARVTPPAVPEVPVATTAPAVTPAPPPVPPRLQRRLERLSERLTG